MCALFEVFRASSVREGEAVRLFLFLCVFPVQQTTSGIGHRVMRMQFFVLATNTLKNVRKQQQ